jgi:hypothetical protein
MTNVLKKAGRPASNQAQTPAQRKRAQRERDNHEIAETPVSVWSERLCLIALSNPVYKAPRNGLARAAWERLGELRGFVDDTR